MKLACKVIEDLLPLYCDGACTEETRALIETHLQECDSCRAYFAKIQEELSIPCRLIEDLLPLYHDSACSGETRMLVDMHLNSCKACRAKLEEIGGALEEPPKPDDMKPLKKLRLDWIRTRKKAILRGTIAGALCVALAVGGWWGLTRWYCIPIRSGDIHISNVCRMSDGAIGFYMDIEDLRYLNQIEITYAGDTVFLTPKRAMLDVYTGYSGFSSHNFYFCSLEPEILHNYPYVMTDEYGNSYDAFGNPVEEHGWPDFFFPDYVANICIGTERDYVVAWDQSMELPAASEEVELLYIERFY